MKNDANKIPEGHYCYKVIDIVNSKKLITETCPYWSNHPEHGYQNDGHCSYLNVSDWDKKDGMSFLWDRVKECGINRADRNGVDYE